MNGDLYEKNENIGMMGGGERVREKGREREREKGRNGEREKVFVREREE